MRLLTSLSSLLLSATLGCEARQSSFPAFDTTAPSAAAKRAAPMSPVGGERVRRAQVDAPSRPEMGGMMAGMMMGSQMNRAQGEQGAPSVDSPVLSRKIIYDSQIDLIAENVDPV